VGLVIPAPLLACALNIAAATLEAIVRVESGGNAIALNVNRLQGPQPHPASAADAVRIAESYIARGFSVDVGLMQVNSRNLPGLGYSLEQALDPCTNITAGGRILTANYAEAVRRLGEGQPALLAALSAYNTGDYSAGFRNGYVARYVGSTSVPALAGGIRQAAASMTAAARPAARKTTPSPYAADIAVEFSEVPNADFAQ
jgi:type IV secretion system protein VirB1